MPGGSAGAGGVAGSTVPTGGVAGDAIGGTSGMGASPAITSCTEEFPYEGEWQGNVLDFFFEPMQEIHLSVRAEEGGAGGWVGELTFGTGDPPPTATDPDAPYPPGYMGGMAGSTGSGQPWPGLPYTVVRGAGCDSVFRVSVSASQTWQSWCAIQAPIDGGEYGWGCMLLTGSYSSNQTTCQAQDGRGNVVAEYPAWKCELCGFRGVCACSQAGCSYNPEPTHSFDLTLSQSGDVDVLSGPDATCGDCTIRLERVE
jgi:hypothetical protein